MAAMEENTEENVKNIKFIEAKTALRSREFHCVEDDWLGKGAYGSVVKAKRRNETFAIKILPVSDKGERVKYRKRELQALMKVKLLGMERQNIIQYHNSWIMKVSDAEHLFIQMELCLNSLLNFVFKNELGGPKIIQNDGPPRFYQQVFQQVLSGLSFIHRIRWVHRDIHPGNILIVNPSPKKVGDIHIKIADFGLARKIRMHIGEAEGLTVFHQLEEVSPFSVGGHFCAPELKTNTYDFKVDVYSAGLVLYFISRYQKDTNEVLKEIKHLKEGKLQVDEYLFHKDDKKLRTLIKNLIQTEPNERYTACEAEAYMFPEARIATTSSGPLEIEFLARKQNEDDLSLCTMKEFTLSGLKEAIERHTRVPERWQILRQERKVNGEMKRIKIDNDKDVENIIRLAEKQGQEVVVVVSENEDVEMTDNSTEPMSVSSGGTNLSASAMSTNSSVD